MHEAHTVLVQVLAAHVACGACGDHARIGLTGDPYYRLTTPMGAFFAAHLAPCLTAVEAQIAGGPVTIHHVHTH